jgi:multicomponent Na+:H+ antiporter subunit C
MEVVMAVVIGGLYAAGVYMVLRRSIVKLILGLALLGNAANLLIFTVGRLTRGRPPIVPEGAIQPAGPVADPLPQALILTAIVIGFGVLAFAMVLVHSAYRAVGRDDLDSLRSTDTLDPTPEDEV